MIYYVKKHSCDIFFFIFRVVISFQNLVILNDQTHEHLEILEWSFGIYRESVGSQFSGFKFLELMPMTVGYWAVMSGPICHHVMWYISKGRPYSGCSGVEASSFSWGRWVGGWGRMAARPVPPTAVCAGTSRLRVKRTESRRKICTPCPPFCPPPPTPHLPP